MRILFALNQNSDSSIEQQLLNHYKSLTQNEFIIAKEYDLSGVNNKFKFENFDILVLNEELERDNPVTTSFIDDLTDRFSISRIIMIIKSDHKTDVYVKKLFNIGVYDLLYSHDISIENIVKLIINPRTKAEAKMYLNLHEIEDVQVESELKYILEDELFNILTYFDSINTSEYSETFDYIINQYNEDQILYLINKLPDSIKDCLEKDLNENYLKYKEMIDNLFFEEERILEETNVSKNIEIEKDKKFNIRNKFNLSGFTNIKNGPTTEKIITKIEKVNVLPADYKKTILLISPESTGKTEIATNLAIGMANKTNKNVALIDLDLDKYGVLYNFKIEPGDNGENYYKYKFLYEKIDNYLSDKGIEITEDEIKELAAYRNKNMLVYTGTQEIDIKNRETTSGNRPINEVLVYMINEIRSLSDVVIIDVGTSTNPILLSELMNMGNVEKLLITTQNIESLNTIPYKLRFKHRRDYNDWRLIINKYNDDVPIKEKELMSFFFDSDIDHMKYVINGINYIPYSDELISMKAKRDVVYKKDINFTEAIDSLINDIYPVDVNKKKKLLGLF